MRATLNGDAPSSGFYGNAFLIFDYQSPTDFKFAGLYVSSGKWAIGHRSNVTWVRDTEYLEPISAGTDYDVQLIIENGQDVTLVANGVTKASYTFGSSVVDGELGLGTWNAFAGFDNLVVQAYVPPPVADGDAAACRKTSPTEMADYFDIHTGTWSVANERFLAAGRGDAIATIRISDPLPNDFELQATVNANASGGGLYSNAFVIFDYQSDTDFKFAGALVGSGKWALVIAAARAGSWMPSSRAPSRVASITRCRPSCRPIRACRSPSMEC